MLNSLEFITTSNSRSAVDFIAHRIIEELKNNHHVLWLVPGGSAITVATEAVQQIALHDHHNLTVTLTDERYGPLNHPDSNWHQLQVAGFNLPQAKLISVLIDSDFVNTNKIFAYNLEKAMVAADYIIGLFGIGSDGHTAGILPHSPAVLTRELTCAYKASNFKRITITPVAIAKFNEGVVFAQGEAKWPVFTKLNQTLKISDQPAQTLKSLERLTIFSDYKN